MLRQKTRPCVIAELDPPNGQKRHFTSKFVYRTTPPILFLQKRD
jgi:hypothetical protein